MESETKWTHPWAVALAQLVERSLHTLEVHGSNPNMSNLYITYVPTVNCFEATKIITKRRVMAQIQQAHMIRIDKRTDKEDLQTERLTRRREGGGGLIVRFDHSRWTHVTDDHFKAVLLDNPSLMIIRLIDKLIQTKSSWYGYRQNCKVVTQGSTVELIL